MITSRNKYYIDERVGCIAVRDSETKSESPGLHRDSHGVICYWIGESENKSFWYVPVETRKKAIMTCDALNAFEKSLEDCANIR